MTELNDIFAHDLSMAVFVWGSIAMLIVFATVVIWSVKTIRVRSTKPAHGGWNPGTLRAATPTSRP
jgi:hypothetical protein